MFQAGEDPRRAAINRYNPDGSGHETYVSGHAQPIGLHCIPAPNALAAVQETRFVRRRPGAGFTSLTSSRAVSMAAVCYIGPHEDPRVKAKSRTWLRKPLCRRDFARARGVLDFVFYTGKPVSRGISRWRILAFHGSWNRSSAWPIDLVSAGNERQPAAEEPRDILTGWMLSPEKREFGPAGSTPSTARMAACWFPTTAVKKIWRITTGS